MVQANKLEVPRVLVPALEKAVERLESTEAWSEIIGRDKALAATLNKVLACSEYVADILVRYPKALEELIVSGRMHRPLASGALDPLFLKDTPDNETEAQFMRRIRLFRHRELVRIIWRDLAGWSDCAETLRELSAVADACIRAGFLRSSLEMQRRYGVPRDAEGQESNFIIVAMGKLGGGELNFSSDIDVVFLYSEPGETDGGRSQSNEEYFRRLAQHFIKMLGDKTSDGFVYRVDARLRPFGDSGPLACSVSAFEDYLQQHGRDWERYAWLKARVVNIWAGTQNFYSNTLRPSVYRRYLDFGVFSSLREMKSMIEQEGRAAANRENIKLGPGGIREIEFIAQTLQLVRGGMDRPLRQRSLMRALEQLGHEQLMPVVTVKELTGAYKFLRDLENRLQMIADRQTHELPTGAENRARLVLANGFGSWDELYAALNKQRKIVQADFDEILRHERGTAESNAEGTVDELPADLVSLEQLAEASFENPSEMLQRLNSMRSGQQYQRMDELGRQRLDRLLPSLLLACVHAGNPLLALDRTLRVVESIGRRSAYMALLNENTAALERLVRLCGSSDFLARQVAAHPLLLDELLDQRIFQEAPTRDDLVEDLQHRLEGVNPEDSEQHFEALRNFQQAAVFRVAVADLSGTLPLMKVSDRLTEIAELVLAEALTMSLQELVGRYGKPMCIVDGKNREAGFAIVGYGKLGGLELGYGSDLDIVFMHDSEGESQETEGENALDNAVFFGRLARRITHVLTMPTPTGSLYEVDTRLRPSGKSGLLVTSLVALNAYQKNEAWTWEHQALLRARAVTGSKIVREAFETLRIRVLLEYVKRETLQDEVIKMRSRMRAELNKSNAEEFDIKQGDGGVIDIEFLVQYLVLLYAPTHEGLLQYPDNIRQLEALRDADILNANDSEVLADTYRAYRVRMHLLSLAGESGLVPIEEFEAERLMVKTLWQAHLMQAP
ncbi:MAG: bifunctional [glutamate--ammonia ligase]-adenylyl-L-tyrosine phosphorylase/[glutamate--ammonia-ligase] adenylyltransferase [Gammaproteobacteria bacterium]|nr:bifunctional [glutamate--ammonia ligase]-adenylyl-L-tyrosine phosphorylase/[glutamate--ammonia-ligase] adenylyltransferase [Gammaproteobacteria bacterium]